MNDKDRTRTNVGDLFDEALMIMGPEMALLLSRNACKGLKGTDTSTKKYTCR